MADDDVAELQAKLEQAEREHLAQAEQRVRQTLPTPKSSSLRTAHRRRVRARSRTRSVEGAACQHSRL
jgi:hypothetical protein